MATWSQNHRECKATWTSLMFLKQIKATFDKTGKIKMTGLTFWSPGDSADMRKTKARALSTQIDKILRQIRLAKFQNSTLAKAVAAMVKTLVTPTATVAVLAEVIDTHYLFRGE